MRKKVQDGIYCSDHGCTIPHASTNLSGARNRDCLYVQLLNGRVLNVPENFHHYVDPGAHKLYARLMPSLEIAEWALTCDTLNFLDLNALPNQSSIERYGYISYVRKNGYLDCGIWDMGRRKGTSYHHPEYAGQLVMTQESDEHVNCKAPVQKSEYKALCSEIAARFSLQVKAYGIEAYFNKVKPTYSNENVNDFLRAAKGFLNGGGDLKTLRIEADRLSKENEIGAGKTSRFEISVRQSFLLSDCERLVIICCLHAGYFNSINFDPATSLFHFPQPEQIVLDQLAAYRNECTSALGYQSPVFERTPALPLEEPNNANANNADKAYDSDDDLKEAAGNCCVM